LALIDLARKTRIGKYRAAVAHSQWYSRDRLESLQLERLKSLLDFAVERVPFYRDLATENGLTTATLKATSDLAAWPVVGKTLMRKEPSAFCPVPMILESVFSRRTGGSTGDPFEYRVGSTAFSQQWAALFRTWEWTGYRLGDPMVTLGGGSVAPAGGLSFSQKVYNGLRRNLPLSAANLDDPTLVRFEKRMRDFRPRMVYGYPSVLYQTALHLNDHGGPIAGVGAVVATSEMLFPAQREVLAQAFQAPVFNLYGCNETNLIAAECENRDGLHIAMESCLVEVLDEDDNPVPAGETGRLVATGLLNRGMIFIRYDTGDLGSLDRSPCSCGRGLIRIRSLEGRQRDLVRTPDGNLVHGVLFNEIILEHPWVDRYQAIQLDEHRLILNVAVSGEVANDKKERLRAEVQELCGLKVELRVNQPFETTSGAKTRVIISRLEDGHDG